MAGLLIVEPLIRTYFFMPRRFQNGKEEESSKEENHKEKSNKKERKEEKEKVDD